MKQFILQILGDTELSTYVNSIFFAFVGMAFSLLFEVVNRDPKSQRTPFTFSKGYLLSDNFERLLAGGLMNVIAVLLAIRFCPELLGIQLSPIVALGIGAGFDKVAQTIKNKLITPKS